MNSQFYLWFAAGFSCVFSFAPTYFQNGTFEPVHEIWKIFWPKVFFWSIMNMPLRKNIHNLPQGPPNPGLMQEKVQKGDFLKKPSWQLKFFCCFRFLWISRRLGKLNWKRLVFLLSKILYKKCVTDVSATVCLVDFCLVVWNFWHTWKTNQFWYQQKSLNLDQSITCLTIRFE